MDYIVDLQAQTWQAGNSSYQHSADEFTYQSPYWDMPDLWGHTNRIDNPSVQRKLPFPPGRWSETVTSEPPSPDAPISDWLPAIRADVRANSILSTESAKRVASGTTRLAVCLAAHGITQWDRVRLDPILEFASEPIRDRYGNVVRDRDPDGIRAEMWRARHILASAARLGARVPLLDSELHDFLYPPPRPERASDDPDAIAETISVWRPQRWRHGSQRGLDKVMPQVREWVTSGAPSDVDQARLWLRTLAGFAQWETNSAHIDLVRGFTWDNIETWVLKVNKHEDSAWQNRARGVLRRLGPIVHPAAWSAPPTPIPRQGIAAPYEPTRERAFWQAAALPRRNKRSRMWVAIGASSGLRGPEIAAGDRRDLVQRPDGRWTISVRGSNPRTVPVRRALEPLVAKLVAEPDESPFIGSDKPGAAETVAQRILVGDQRLSLTAARNTFLVAHLRAGTPQPALSKIAGGVSMSTLDRLHAYVTEELDDNEAVERALGV